MKQPLLIFIVIFAFACVLFGAAAFGVSSQSQQSGYYWTNGSKMPTPRSAMAAALLDDKIYVVGGQGSKVKKDKIVEVYDIKSDKWTPGPSLPEPLDHLGMASYDGKLYVVGGTLKYGY